MSIAVASVLTGMCVSSSCTYGGAGMGRGLALSQGLARVLSESPTVLPSGSGPGAVLTLRGNELREL